MLVLPTGLLKGERIAKCSDEAQLHFPRLAALTNGFGRLQLNLRVITETAYAGFRSAPSREQLSAWLREYVEAHLLFVYEGPDGAPWGQWRGIPENMLPRWKTTSDKRSPQPPAEELAKFDEGYASLKKASGDFLSVAEHFGKLPKASEDFGNLQKTSAGEVVDEVLDEVVDEASDEGIQKQVIPSPSAPALTSATSEAKPKASAATRGRDAERVYEAYPHKVGKPVALKAIAKALTKIAAKGEADPVEYLRARIAAWTENRTRIERAGGFLPELPNPSTWFNQERYDDEANQPKPKVEYVVLSDEETADAWARDFGGLKHVV